jgi:hypothetical protein
MASLGIRIIPTFIRYAVLESIDGTIVFQNAESENLIKFPKNSKKIEDKIKWTYDEIERILRKYPSINSISIKEDEIITRKTLTSREKAYITGVIVLIASQKCIAVNTLIYKQIKTKSENVKIDAAKIVNPLIKNWDNEIASAVCCAAYML